MKNLTIRQKHDIGGRSLRLGTLLMVASMCGGVADADTTHPTGGVLITRLNSENWSVTVIGGGEQRQLSATVDSSEALGAVTRVKMESGDHASLSSSTQLSLSLSASATGEDSVQFTAPVSSKLCIRDTGSTSAPLYVGTTLDNAVPVSLPYALAGSDACGPTGNIANLATTAAAAASSRKSNTGHYIALMRSQSSTSVMASSIKPGVVGFMKRYTWKELEPSAGSYNFAGIKSDLSWAASNGMHIIIMIEDKTFTLERPTPSYLDSYTVRNRAGGYTVLRWNTYVVGRWKALVKAIGAQFDSNTAFEGIATQETSLGLEDPVLNANGYTPEKYRDAYIDMFTDAGKTMPKSHVFWFMNFFVRNQSYIASVASAVASSGVVMGGPDVMPDNKSLVTRTYPYYSQFDSKMSLFGQVEDVCYSQLHATGGYKTKYWTMPELFKYARDNLHVNYLFWVRVPNASPSDSYDYYDAVPVMQSNPTFN
ncbi:MAG: hypothetical protein U1F35_19230 [Steroidobacteraceae bacterium]